MIVPRAAWTLSIAVGLLAVPGRVSAQRGGAPIPVQVGVDVDHDTVRVGDPFIVQVGIRAPAGAAIDFPPGPDSTSAVQALDPPRVEEQPDSAGGVLKWAFYRLAAWDIGEQPIVLGDVVVQLGGDVRRVPLGDHGVFVASVLPADTTLRVPKPARSLFTFGPPFWWWWIALAALLVVALLLWWWLRRRRRAPALVVTDPFAEAEREFARIEKLGLVEAGERGRFVALMVDVLRDYLAARYDVARLSLTSSELLAALRAQHFVSLDRLARVLGEADLVKFAQRPVSSERARELGREARAIVAHDHAATRAPAVEKAA